MYSLIRCILRRFFQDAQTSVDASLSSIIVAAITLVTVSHKPFFTRSNISTFQVVLVCLLGGKASRRQMMLVSQFGVTVCLFTMALYFLLGGLDLANSFRSVPRFEYLELIFSNFRWLPLVILVLYFVLFNIGLSSYVWVITAEILPTEIRDQIIPLAILVSSFLWFLVTFFFNAMFVTFGGLYIFLFYAFISLFFSIISFVFLPETTGKSPEEISKFFTYFTIPCLNKY